MAESGLQQAWTKYVAEGRVRTNATRKQAETFVQRLVKQGELTSDQFQKAVDELVKRSQKRAEELKKEVQREIREQLSSLGVATKDDIARIERKIAASAKATPARKPAAKKPAAKKPAAKKPAARKAAPKSTARARSAGTTRRASSR